MGHLVAGGPEDTELFFLCRHCKNIFVKQIVCMEKKNTQQALHIIDAKVF